MYQNNGQDYYREPMMQSQSRASKESDGLQPYGHERPSVDLSSVAGSVAGSVRRRYDGSAYDGYDY